MDASGGEFGGPQLHQARLLFLPIFSQTDSPRYIRDLAGRRAKRRADLRPAGDRARSLYARPTGLGARRGRLVDEHLRFSTKIFAEDGARKISLRRRSNSPQYSLVASARRPPSSVCISAMLCCHGFGAVQVAPLSDGVVPRTGRPSNVSARSACREQGSRTRPINHAIWTQGAPRGVRSVHSPRGARGWRRRSP